MKAKVDKELCIGCGLCTEICPSVFFMDDSGKAVAKPMVSTEKETECREAATQCPVEAIKIE